MATRVPLYFNSGDDETRTFQYLSGSTPVNITGYTAVFNAFVGDQNITCVGSVDGVNGKVNVSVTHTQTTALSTGGESGFYEVIITSSGGSIKTIAEGPLVFLTP